MSENHIALAQSRLLSSAGIVRGADGTSPEAAELIAEAQAHATIALAEQQRIANKVAFGQVAQLGELARLLAPAGYPRDPAIPTELILTADEESLLGIEDPSGEEV